MNDFNNYRGSILNKTGDFINYENSIVQNGDIYFRNAGNNMFIIYMPESITQEQLYELELNDSIIDKFDYLGVVKCSNRFEFTKNIWSNFSSEVIQSYFRKK